MTRSRTDRRRARARGLLVAGVVSALVGLVAGCGSDDDVPAGPGDGATTTTTITTTPTTEPTVEEGLEEYVGLDVADAGARAEADGRPWRIVHRDGEDLPVTMDYIEDRLNFAVEAGNVVGVTTG